MMFSKLYKKIYIPIVIIALVLAVFLDVFAIIVESSTLKEAYRDMAEKKLERIMNSCRLYVSSAETTTLNLSLDETVIDELALPTGRAFAGKLEDACNYSLRINAVCVYSVTGEIYTSSAVTQVPDMETLKKDEGIKKFIEGENDSYISFRTHSIANIYNNSVYPEEMGVISCCRKVYKEGALVGWIFTDILPVNLYSYVFGEGQFDNAVAFITTNDGYFVYGDNKEKATMLDGRYGGYFRYSARSDDGQYSLVVFDSKSGYTAQLTVLVLVLLAGTALILVAVITAARAAARSVTSRLDKFLIKTNSVKLP